jgi:hypothetical protein
MSSRNLNCDIEIPFVIHPGWDAGKLDLGMRSPAAKDIGMAGICYGIGPLQQMQSSPCAQIRGYRGKITLKSTHFYLTNLERLPRRRGQALQSF